MPRLFTAIELPEDVKDRLGDLEKPLPGAKWVPTDDLHITLRFMGDVEGLIERELCEMLAGIDADAFELRLADLGAFGGSEPRIIWAGVAESPALATLARANERAARAAGLPPESRVYKPHVTLARLSGTPPEIVARYLGRIGAFRSRLFPVSRFVLYSSKPKSGGGPYVVEESFLLRGGWHGDDGDEPHGRWR